MDQFELYQMHQFGTIDTFDDISIQSIDAFKTTRFGHIDTFNTT